MNSYSTITFEVTSGTRHSFRLASSECHPRPTSLLSLSHFADHTYIALSHPHLRLGRKSQNGYVSLTRRPQPDNRTGAEELIAMFRVVIRCRIHVRPLEPAQVTLIQALYTWLEVILALPLLHIPETPTHQYIGRTIQHSSPKTQCVRSAQSS